MNGRLRRIAVTGATGVVGQFLVDALAVAGYEVVVLARPQSNPGPLPKTARVRPFQLDPSCRFSEALTGVDGLVHAAFQHAPGLYRGGEGDDLGGFIRANVHGSLSLLLAARTAGVKRCVVLSSRAVYGRQPLGRPLLEETATHPDTHYGAVKAALEGFVSSFGLGEGWPIAALRPTGIYGVISPISRSKWFDTISSLLRGEDVPARGGTEVHGRDVAAAILRLLAAPDVRVAGRIFNCSDLFVSTRDIAQMVAAAAGRDIALPDAVDSHAFTTMDCSALRSLGARFGGEALLRKTVERLVAAAIAHEGLAARPGTHRGR